MVGAVIVISWVLSAGVAGFIASTKGRNVGGFAIAGLLLGPAGVVWAALAHPSGYVRRDSAAEIRARAARPLSGSRDWRRHLEP